MVWETRRRELKSAPYELFVILVTVLSIVNLVLAFVLRPNQAMQDILKVMNIVLSLILFCDFVYRFATADARGRLTSGRASAGRTCSRACPSQRRSCCGPSGWFG